MSSLSRRQFLKSSGLTLLVGAGSRLSLGLFAPQDNLLCGRALTALSVYDAPSPTANLNKHLWPDTVVPILDTVRDWYRLHDGYVKRSTIQPMVLRSEVVPAPTPPFWAEVGSAVAVVRRWGAADAPVVTRIGHGGVAQVIDILPSDNTHWYLLSNEDTTLGWSQASPWNPITNISPQGINGQIYINTQTGQLRCVENSRTVLSAPVSFGIPLEPGSYPLNKRKRSVIMPLENASDGYYVVPWHIQFGDYAFAGAYWHNEFGEEKFTPGSSVQVTPPLARWIYERLPDGTLVTVQ